MDNNQFAKSSEYLNKLKPHDYIIILTVIAITIVVSCVVAECFVAFNSKGIKIFVTLNTFLLLVLMVLGSVWNKTNRTIVGRLLNLNNLWVLVFVGGFFVSLLDFDKTVKGAGIAYLDVDELLRFTSNMVITLFFALVTSVVGKSFAELDMVSERLSEIHSGVKGTDMELKKSIDQVKNSITLLKSLSDEAEISRIINGLRSKVDEKSPSISNILYSFNAVITKANKAELRHLLPAGSNPFDGESFKALEENIANLDNDYAIHSAYMAIAVGKMLEKEKCSATYSPGVIFSTTTFTYYAEVVKEIVQLFIESKKVEEYEFYTLMPRSLFDMYRYSNHIDISRWEEFLDTYHQFQIDFSGISKWKRIFAYFPGGDPSAANSVSENVFHQGKKTHQKLGLINENYLKSELNCGYYVMDKDKEWKPKVIATDQIEIYIERIKNEESREAARMIYQEREKRGFQKDTVIVLADSNQENEKEWKSLRSGILQFHKEKRNIGFLPINEEKYRRIFFSHDIEEKINGGSEYYLVVQEMIDQKITKEIGEHPGTIKFKLPRDLFAIKKKEKNSNVGKGEWVLVIGFDEAPISSKCTGKEYYTCTIIDLEILYGSRVEINRETATHIRSILNEMFDDEKCKDIDNFAPIQ